jgi:glucokinase
LAELNWGAAKNAKNFAWATIGTGFGGYLFLNGRLYPGCHGFAGNFGHVTLDEAKGYPCGCGKRGCAETFVAGPAIARAAEAAIASGASQALERLAAGRHVAPGMVFEAESKHDEAAKAIVAEVVRRVALSFAGLVNILDLEMIIVGGGVARGSADFLPRVDLRIREFLMTEEARRDLRIVPESFPNAALFGAAAELFHRLGDLPPLED